MAHSTARVETTTRTIHTISLTLPDDALAEIAFGDEAEIVIMGRGRPITKRLTYGDVQRLTDAR